MKFKNPKTPKDEMEKYFADIIEDIDNGFRKLIVG